MRRQAGKIVTRFHILRVKNLVEADELPPDGAHAEPQHEVDDGDGAAEAPPGGEGRVALAEVGGGGPDAVVGGAAHEVGEDAQHNGAHHGGGACAGGERNSECDSQCVDSVTRCECNSECDSECVTR
eukprot:1342580-Pyramimonas_sp.AAC.1